MPKLSVLMAHAGPATFVDEACRSLRAQSHRDFELVVVDDGARLDWQRYLRGSPFDWRVLEHPAPLGLGASLNQAAASARGEWLARMDSDDVSHERRLEAQADYLASKSDVSFVGSAVSWLDESSTPLGRSFPLTDGEDLALGLLAYNQLCHGSVMMRRAAFEAAGGYDVAHPLAQDYALWLAALERGSRFANLPEPLYGLRLHPASASNRRAHTQHGIARSLRKHLPEGMPIEAVEEWFDAGRDRPFGRPYERLQLGRLAILLAVLSRRCDGPRLRRRMLAFAARHAGASLSLLRSEVGWRQGAAGKLRSLLG